MKDHKLFTVIPYKDKLIQLENPVVAIAYYKDHALDLITGETLDLGLEHFFSECRKIKIKDQFRRPRIMHLFYELGFFMEKQHEALSSDLLLAIDICYADYRTLKVGASQKIQLKKLSSPDKKDYQKSFEEGYEELLKGNCYQFNLTYPFLYQFQENLSPYDFIFSLWKKQSVRGAFGSATYLPSLKKMFFSNSPECLFQVKDQILSSMPIKGTLKRSDGEDWRLLWKKLISDKKSQAELFMISDLLRNDLSKIEKPKAQIVKAKFPKLVPGLIHQYSQIDVHLSEDVSLIKILESLFPGGSVTGAPKVRVMKILRRLEKRDRSFYCGSTVMLFGKMKSASINIRSAEINFNNDQRTLCYQAGGGITLLSTSQDEFLEMTYKHNSFIDALTL